MKIKSHTFHNFDTQRVPSPCFVVDQAIIEQNLQVLQQVKQASGAKVLLALKAFSLFALAPLITKYLDGCCASGLNEALLAQREFGGNASGEGKREVHVYAPAFKQQELQHLCEFVDHLVLNSLSQWQRFKPTIQRVQQTRPLHCGLRVNPMLSLGDTPLYDPCAPKSRLGIPIDVLKHQLEHADELQGISGLHFHTLCQQGYVPLAQTLDLIEAEIGEHLHAFNWLNFGGGHHITDNEYDTAALAAKIKALQSKYQLQVYLEPGEAIAIHSGVLVSEVLDITRNSMDLAILDTSATCHMPDTLEMPYRAEILLDSRVQPQGEAGQLGEKPYAYRLGGQTCLAGDVIGDYSFDQALEVGQRLMFDDMSHYTMVKTTTFNGIGLPAIALWDSRTDALQVVKQFGYQDFASRLS